MLASSSEGDSLRRLDEVVVTAKPQREMVVGQRLGKMELHNFSSFSVADALRFMAGVQIKDYGGIGGLKTVNVRSLGTNHVGVFYDGIQLGNAQNGQIDLGKFSLDNMEEISLYNGHKGSVLQSAKDFGSASSLYLRTRIPDFSDGKVYHLTLKAKTGSFGLLNPSLLWEQKLSTKISGSLNAEWVQATGKYKFRYRRVHPSTGKVVYDTTATRANGDVKALRVEGNVFGKIDQGQWNAKVYFYNSERGIPGAIVNNVWKHSQRQWDRNALVQGEWQKTVNQLWSTKVSGKYAYDYLHYLNPDTTLLYINNTFRQQETYWSWANKLSVARWWDVSLSADWQYNTLASNLAGFVKPQRSSFFVAVASTTEWGMVKLQADVLGTWIREATKGGKAAPHKQAVTPAVMLTIQPLKDFSIRTFYKNSFRMPTFNDLYYTDIGNVNLKPEYAQQYDIGFRYEHVAAHGFWRRLNVEADAYYNKVTDKIVAVPKGNGMYRWMMMNLGFVKIRGIDASAAVAVVPARDWTGMLRLTYTFQKAQDYSERKNPQLQQLTWGGQIPYIPWHSGSIMVGGSYRTWSLNYSFVYVGERYHSSANIPVNYEQPWYTHDINLTKTFDWKNLHFRAALEVNNLLGQDYEIVLNYPMPKRNYKFTLSLTL